MKNYDTKKVVYKCLTYSKGILVDSIIACLLYNWLLQLHKSAAQKMEK